VESTLHKIATEVKCSVVAFDYVTTEPLKLQGSIVVLGEQ